MRISRLAIAIAVVFSVLATLGEAASRRLGEGLARRTVLAHDDYEDAAAKREGNPQIVRGDISPGMLTPTGQGRYRTSGAKQLNCTQVGLVSGDGMFVESSIRIYGIDEGTRLESAFVVGALPGEHAFSAAIVRHGESLDVTVSDDGRPVGTRSVSVAKLPADLSVAVSPSGEFRVSVRSLADSSVEEAVGRTEFLSRYPNGFRAFWWMRAPEGAKRDVELTVDELWVGLSRAEDAAAVPYSIDRLETFDPDAAGWKLVFSDDFDGERVAWGDKWFQTYYNVNPREHVSLDGEGHVRIKVDYAKGSTNRLVSSGLYTKEAFGYGYYAARVKFTRQNGFWSAFWTYGDANSNPFLDGFEIDGYEDYYLREKDAAGKTVGDMLDHNLHIRGGLGRSKSWNYKTRLEGLDEWHVLGVRWTPFEISYYLDGKLMKSVTKVGHSPYDSVTFDAFHHAACTAPNHAVLSGCIMHATWNKRFQDLTGCRFPDYFTVDWVKVWEYPDPPETRPSVAWTAETSAADAFAPTGSVVKLSVDVAQASATGARIRGVYLFDSGFFLQHRTEPPFAFEIPLTEEFYSRTAYARPGRQREVFTLAKDVPHVFHVFVQDENGRVGRTDVPLFRIPKRGESAPYGDRAQVLPGTLNPTRFDRGGTGVAYYKHPMTVEKVRPDLNPRPSYAVRGDEHVSCSESGDAIDFTMSSEWMNYTVEIAAAGRYTVEFPYGTPGRGWNELRFLVDGKPAGSVTLEPHDDALDASFVRDRTARTELELPAGRHVLTLLPIGPVSFGSLAVSAVGTSVAAESLETAKWQEAIDRAAAAGGGTVVVPAGRHRVAGLALKSGVTLELAEGCVLEGSTNISNYADIHLRYAEVPEPWQAVVWAEDQTNIAVVGKGTIDGNGLGFGQWLRVGRPRGMLFHRCANVRVEGITMRSLASWTCYYKECDGVVHRNVTVYSHDNWNTDGVDIEAKNVLVENCRFDTGDDGIVLKSDNPFFAVEDVLIRNCDIGTSCNVFKIGTASHGAFRRIRFENVRGHSATGELPLEKDRIHCGNWRREGWPGLESLKDPLGGIVVECVDGAHLEDVSFKDIDLGRVNVPIFIRAGMRRSRKAFGKPLGIPFGTGLTLRNVRIENVRATGTSWTASSITGVPGLRIEGVTLKNVEISVPGAGAAGAKDLALGPVPEKENSYPESNMFDNRILPAYGFYVRHADNVRFENVTITPRGADPRPRIATDDCRNFDIMSQNEAK